MIDGNLIELIDILNYGEDLYFIYNETKYFIQGWVEEKESTMVLSTEPAEPFSDYLWKTTGHNLRECASEFLNAPIWSGKTFLEIESEVRWTD